MIDSVLTMLEELGFTITEKKNMAIAGHIDSFGNGCFDIHIDFRDNTFKLKFSERVASIYLFFIQKFDSADCMRKLIEGSYIFQECVTENSGESERKCKEYIKTTYPEFAAGIPGSRL